FCSTIITDDSLDHALSFVEGRLNAPKTAASENRRLCRSGRGTLRSYLRNSKGERYAAESQKKNSIHIVEIRHSTNQGVVNKSDRFCLPSTGETVISGFTFSHSETHNDQSRRDSLQYHFPGCFSASEPLLPKRGFDFSSACLRVRIA